MKLEKIKLRESELLMEGTHYDKEAIKILVNSGLFDEETATKIIQSLYRGEGGHPEIDAFNHAPNWLSKYIKGIARMIVEESNGDRNRASQFLTDSPQVFDKYLKWIKENRTEQNAKMLDDEFVNQMKYQDVKDFVDKQQAELDAQSEKELASKEFSGSSNYRLVPIDSYNQMHQLYGGHWTGDGSSDKYAGGGGTAWCHTNDENTYDRYINRYGGNNKFFVLERKDFKDILFNPKTNEETRGQDEYGRSLIALLISPKGKLKCATLRCNHIGNPVGGGDNEFKTYSELSNVAGFNVADEIKKYYDIPDFDASKMFIVNDGVFYRNTKMFDEYDECYEITSCKVPDGVIEIADGTFKGCTELKSVELKEGLNTIGEYAFYGCRELTKINLPSSLKDIKREAFRNCNIESVIIPKNVKHLGYGVFADCGYLSDVRFEEGIGDVMFGDAVFYNCPISQIKLPNIEDEDGNSRVIPSSMLNGTKITSFEIPDGVETIMRGAFAGCRELTSIKIPNGCTKLGGSVFYSSGLESISIPNTVEEIGSSCFEHCENLTKITIPGSVKCIQSESFEHCKNLTSVVFEEGVEELQDDLFYGCYGIKTITIPNSVVSIKIDSIPSGAIVITENPYVLEFCVNNNIKFKTSALKEGRPYITFTYNDYLNYIDNIEKKDKYTPDKEGFEAFAQFIDRIYSKKSTIKTKFNNAGDSFVIMGRHQFDEPALKNLIVGLYMPKDTEIKYYVGESLSKKCKEKALQEKIVKKGSKYQVQSEKGRNLGTYDTKEEAEKRLKQVEYFKHKDDIKEGVQDQPLKSNGIYSVKDNKWIKEPVQTDIPDIDYDAFEEQFKGWEDRYFELVENETMSNEEKITEIENLIEDIYDLRKSSISSDGEYSIGNLTFKEFRNLGYLDNLKDMKNALKSKELSLEGLNEEIKLNEMKGTDSIKNPKIVKLIEDCINDLKGIDFPFGNNEVLTYDDIDFQEGSTTNTFGCITSVPNYNTNRYTLTLNKHMYDEPDEAIKNTIYHELCHYITSKFAIDKGAFAKEGGHWIGVNSKGYKDYKGHGQYWKRVSNIVSSKVGTNIQRTDSYSTHTGVGQHYEDSVKYIVKCNNCGREFKYQKMTDFVKNPNKMFHSIIDNKDKYSWTCKCGAEGQFEVVKK